MVDEAKFNSHVTVAAIFESRLLKMATQEKFTYLGN